MPARRHLCFRPAGPGLVPRRPNYLSLVRDAGHKVIGVGKISDIFAGSDVDDSFPTKSNVDGINRTI